MSAGSPSSIGSAANSIGSDLRELSEPTTRGEKIQEIIGRAAHRAGLPYWRTYNIWFGKARRIEPHERDAIAAAVEEKREEALRNEVHDLRLRLARLESLLVQKDPHFDRSAAGPGRARPGGFGGMGRPVGAKA